MRVWIHVALLLGPSALASLAIQMCQLPKPSADVAPATDTDIDVPAIGERGALAEAFDEGAGGACRSDLVLTCNEP